MNRTPISPTPLLAIMSVLMVACGADRDSLEVTITEHRVFGQRYLVPSVHSSADIRPGDLELTILAQGEIAECTFENPDPIFAEDEKESQLRYKSDRGSTRLEDLSFEDLMQSGACEFEVKWVEEVTARMDGRRMRCGLEDTPAAENEAPEQETEEEARGLFGFRRPEVPPAEFRKYSCR